MEQIRDCINRRAAKHAKGEFFCFPPCPFFFFVRKRCWINLMQMWSVQKRTLEPDPQEARPVESRIRFDQGKIGRVGGVGDNEISG